LKIRLTYGDEIMDVTALVTVLAVGALAGWLAGNILKGRGFGLFGNIVVGIIGAVVGALSSAYLAFQRVA
jgi:uncharacterized membrane protein YeaQ/YmgE (transglycosylase-associated protein family)